MGVKSFHVKKICALLNLLVAFVDTKCPLGAFKMGLMEVAAIVLFRTIVRAQFYPSDETKKTMQIKWFYYQYPLENAQKTLKRINKRLKD